MARVYVSVPDPLSYRAESSDLPPLMIGAFVETRIEAEPIKNVIRIARDNVRANNTVWVMENEKLSIRAVTIAFLDADYAYVTDGLRNGDRVVTTSLAKIKDGAPLRLKNAGQEDTQTSGDTK